MKNIWFNQCNEVYLHWNLCLTFWQIVVHLGDSFSHTNLGDLHKKSVYHKKSESCDQTENYAVVFHLQRWDFWSLDPEALPTNEILRLSTHNETMFRYIIIKSEWLRPSWYGCIISLQQLTYSRNRELLLQSWITFLSEDYKFHNVGVEY